MIKLFITIILFSSAVIFSQDENPNVELPDFVILGRDVVSIRKVEKIKPDFIPTISSEFLKPTYKPDQLEVTGISNPIGSDLSLLDSANYNKGYIELKAGRYQLPSGEISYAFPFARGILHGSVKGLNQLDYVDNSDKQFLEGVIDFAYTLPTDLGAFAGTKFTLSGDHSNNIFKFFGSSDPGRKRTLKIGNAVIGVQNLYMKEFNFDLKAGSDFTYLDNEKFNEALYYGKGFAKVKFSDFGLGIKALYQNQNLTTDSVSNFNSDYFFIRPTASLEIFNKIMLETGFTFSGSGNQKFNALYVSIGAELMKNLTLLAEYSPQGENQTAGYFLQNNYYYNQQDLTRIFLKKKNKITAALKYEYGTYYQIDGGIEFFKADNFPFYYNPNSDGFFEVGTTDVNSYDYFLNLLYYLGPYGYLYAHFDYLDVKNSDNQKIPYFPDVKANLTYGYYFLTDWKGEAKLYYISEKYTNLDNQKKLPSYWNLGLKISYEFEPNIGVFFEINNVLNTSRYIWEGYKEKPIDLALGISFLFK